MLHQYFAALGFESIPLSAAERDDTCPIVIGGGPCVYNPEPIAEFFDLFYIGEGETSYDALLNLYIQNKAEGSGRREFLRKAASIPGIYVPSLYEVHYNSDGTLAAFAPSFPGVPEKVEKQVVMELNDSATPQNQSCHLSRRPRTG